MFIQTEDTPNPDSLKFIPGRTVRGEESPLIFNKEDNASPRSLLATRLLSIPGVVTVLFGSDFITISKSSNEDWYVLKPMILGMIMEHFINGLPLVEMQESSIPHTNNDIDDAIIKQIRELIDTRVRPAVAQDGGDIVFDSFEDGIVYLRMHGACSGCPSSTLTLKSGIENMLKFYVPEVQEVRQA